MVKNALTLHRRLPVCAERWLSPVAAIGGVDLPRAGRQQRWDLSPSAGTLGVPTSRSSPPQHHHHQPPARTQGDRPLDGSFAVVWTDRSSADGSSYGIYMQRRSARRGSCWAANRGQHLHEQRDRPAEHRRLHRRLRRHLGIPTARTAAATGCMPSASTTPATRCRRAAATGSRQYRHRQQPITNPTWRPSPTASSRRH